MDHGLGGGVVVFVGGGGGGVEAWADGEVRELLEVAEELVDDD